VIITSTSISFIFLALGLSLCGWRFWRAANRDSNARDKIGILISLYFFSFSIQDGLIGIGALLFAHSPYGLFLLFTIANLTLAFVAMFGVYIIYYIFFPTHSPWLALVFICLTGFLEVVADIVLHVQPLITSTQSIDQNIPWPLSLAFFYLLFISIGVCLCIFIKLFFQTKSIILKLLSVIFSLSAVAGISNNFLKFVMPIDRMNGTMYDAGIALTGLLFILTIPLFSWLRRPRKKQTRYVI
jgi:hypothetical protein